MKTRSWMFLAVLCLLCVFCVGQSNAQDNWGRYIVTIQGPPGPAEQAVNNAGGVVLHVYDIIPAIAISIPEPALAGLERNPKVVSIEPDVVATATKRPLPPSPPPPPAQPAQVLPWGIDRIDAEYAQAAGFRGAGTNVAIIDTGIDRDHPDLIDNIKGGVNFVGTGPAWKRRVDSTAWDDDNGHGTHVAGIVAARDNGIGVVGVAPLASLYAVKVLNGSGSGYVSDIIAGIQWCINNNIDLINMSLGANTDVQAFHDACDAARTAGLLLVAAAGNDGASVSYPAAYSTVIAVAATDSSDHMPWWSNYGPEIVVAAPGVGIYSTYMGGVYDTLSGTSMAAPHVTGTLALNLSANLAGTADDLPPAGKDNYTGYGLVDAGEAATGIVNVGNN